MQTWLDVVFNKDKESMDKMLFYCDGDIVALRSLFYKLKPWVNPSFHYGVHKGGKKFSCPECGSTKIQYNKQYTTKAGTIKHYVKCSCCSKPYQINNKQYMDYLQFKMMNK